MPRNTYLIACDLRCAFDLYSFPGVQWIGPVTPSMKISPFFSSSRHKRTSGLPNQAGASLDLTVVTLALPLAQRRRTGTQQGLHSLAMRWQDEISGVLGGKFERSSGGHRIADVIPVTADNLHVRIYRNGNNILVYGGGEGEMNVVCLFYLTFVTCH